MEKNCQELKKLSSEVFLPSAGKYVHMLSRIWFLAKRKKKRITKNIESSLVHCEIFFSNLKFPGVVSDTL